LQKYRGTDKICELTITKWRRTLDIEEEELTRVKDRNPLFVRTITVNGQLMFFSNDISRHFVEELSIDLRLSTVLDHMCTIHTTTAGSKLTKIIDYEGLKILIDYERGERRQKLLEFVKNVVLDNELNTPRSRKVKVYMTKEERGVLL